MYPYMRKAVEDLTHREKGDVENGKERDFKILVLKIRMMWPQAKECLEPPEARRERNGFSHRASRGSTALPTH